VDDNPVERRQVRRFLPEVEVISLPADPAYYVRALTGYLHLEPPAFTREDADRTQQYQARARVVEAREGAGSMEEFYRSLQMEAVIEPFSDLNLPRVAQLIGKTNQFNLTTRRHGAPQIERFMEDPRCIHFTLRLRDCFADHGLVSLMIGFVDEGVVEIDTWLMSCRVIGRTVENQMLHHLAERAAEMECTSIRGTYIPTAKNALVKDLFQRFGFRLTEEVEGATTWEYELSAGTEPFASEFIMAHTEGTLA
jgi:FkbH-like protein